LELSRSGFLSLAGCSFDCAVTRQIGSYITTCTRLPQQTESRAIVLTFLLDALPPAGRFYIRCENAAEHVDTLPKRQQEVER
jgi:hypothetical protein